MADGRVTIKTNVDDKSIKDLRSTLQDLESAFKKLQGIDPFSGVSKEARNLMNDFTGVSSSAEKVEQDIDDIDGKSMDDVSKRAGDASSGLDDTASAADKADASIDDVDGKSFNDVSQEAGKAEKSIEEADKETEGFSLSLADIGKSAVVISAVTKAFDVLVGSLDDAITRFDTLNRFPRTMEALGYETAVVDRSTRALTRGIEGLPTKLDDVIQTAQRLGGMTGDLDDATETTLALNNAFLASGSSSADAARGTEQYIQMLGNGKVDMMSWRTLTESMNYALLETAESFGYTGPSALNDFYNALMGGDVSFTQFNKRLQELNNAQGGFAEVALTNSEGIATSWQNIQTAISRNVANIVEALDEVVESITGQNIAQNLNNFKFIIDDVFGAATSIIKGLTPVIEVLYGAFKLLLNILSELEPVIWGVVAAITAFKVITTVTTMWGKLTTAVGLATTAFQLFNTTAAITGGGMLTLTGLKAGLTAVIGKVTVAATGASGALGVLKTVITALSGPIGWVVAGIGALVAGGVAIYKTFIEASEETQALGESLKDTAGETAELNDLVDQTASTYEKTKEATDAQYDSIEQLAKETAELAEQEMLSAGEKKILKDNVDELNDSVDGLNLVYDEEQQRLTASNDAMEERIAMAEEDAKYNDARERRTEIEEQHAEATALLTENERELAEAQEYLDNLPWYQSSGEAKEGVEELQAENERLTEQIGVLTEEQVSANEEMEISANKLAEAEEAANSRRITSWEQMPPAMRETAEAIKSEYQGLVDKARDWSTQIETEYTKTNEAGEEYVVSSREAFNDAKETLQNNVEAMREWSENMDKLAERGVSDGILEHLRSMGPEGLPLVEGFVNASDEELSEMEGLFGETAEVSKDAMISGLAIEDGTIVEGVEGLVFNTGESLASAVESSGMVDIIPEALRGAEEDMVQAGGYIAEGATRGLEGGTPDARAASENMADEINQGFSGQLQIQSPSQVFVAHGQDITKGAEQGIKQGTPAVVAAIKELSTQLTDTMEASLNSMNINSDTGFKQLVQTIENSFDNAVNTVTNGTKKIQDVTDTGFNGVNRTVDTSMNNTVRTLKSRVQSMVRDTQSGMNRLRSNVNRSMSMIPPLVRNSMNASISSMNRASGQAQVAGRQLGMGFYWGLNSTAGSIYSLATSIARNAVNRINSALRVQSPSREGFESGDFLGMGVWLGMKNQVSNVEKWSDKLGEAALLDVLNVSPLGMNSQFLTGATNQGGTVNESTTYQDNRTFDFNANANGTEGNDREFYQRMFREFKWMMQNEGGAFNG